MNAFAILFFWLSLANASQALGNPANPCQVEIDSSFPAEIKNALLQTLSFIESIQGTQSSPLHQQIFEGPVNGATYCKFIQDRIRGFRYVNFSGDSSLYAENHLGYMLIGDLFLNDTIVDRASSILHEARHSEGWPHANCPIPFLDDAGKPIVGTLSGDSLAGTRSCDTEALSAYGLEVIWARNIEKYCTNCGADVKALAALNEKVLIFRIIDADAKASILQDQ